MTGGIIVYLIWRGAKTLAIVRYLRERNVSIFVERKIIGQDSEAVRSAVIGAISLPAFLSQRPPRRRCCVANKNRSHLLNPFSQKVNGRQSLENLTSPARKARPCPSSPRVTMGSKYSQSSSNCNFGVFSTPAQRTHST